MKSDGINCRASFAIEHIFSMYLLLAKIFNHFFYPFQDRVRDNFFSTWLLTPNALLNPKPT